ncbi:MAG: radical SAM protein [Chloroflexota bacterium]
MITEITSKTILNHVKQPDPWFGLKYNLNLYRGCQHQCIYCDSRSTCYQIENFADIHVKTNAIDLLADALPRKRMRGTIGTGSMNDPYMPVERQYNLTGRALSVIVENQFPVHVLTKSDLVLRDIDLIKEISQIYAAVSFTITTPDDQLAKELEPAAPPPSSRFKAMQTLSDAGILTGVLMMPILPFIEDTLENITDLVEQAHANGASYIIPSFGMTLRSGSREYYYAKLDQRFPGIKARYIQRYGSTYGCYAPNHEQLNRRFEELCQRYGIANRMPSFKPEKVRKLSRQMKLF